MLLGCNEHTSIIFCICMIPTTCHIFKVISRKLDLIRFIITLSVWGCAKIRADRHLTHGLSIKMDVKPHHLDCPLVAGCSIGHEPWLLHVSGWDMDPTKDSKYKSNILGSSCHSDVSLSVNISWLTAETDSRLVKHVYRQDLDTIAPSPDRYSTEYKWCHQEGTSVFMSFYICNHVNRFSR